MVVSMDKTAQHVTQSLRSHFTCCWACKL